MKKYICTICGFIYDESMGYPQGNIKPGTSWDDISNDWVCPLCSASKSEFQEQNDVNSVSHNSNSNQDTLIPENSDYSLGELSAICSNLSKGCEKQCLLEEADLFNQLATYFENKLAPADSFDLSSLQSLLQEDLDTTYNTANKIANNEKDRGTLRALKWSEQVTRILNAHINKVDSQGSDRVKYSQIYVCEICGFVYIGDERPELCPICKVPSMKLTQVQRGA